MKIFVVGELNLLWNEFYTAGRRESPELMTPEEQIITGEEKKFMKLLINIYNKDGVDGLTDYFFENLKFKKYEQVDSIADFFKKITGQLPLRVSPRIERRLIEEAQIMSRHQTKNYALKLGKVLFGQDKFSRMLRAR